MKKYKKTILIALFGFVLVGVYLMDNTKQPSVEPPINQNSNLTNESCIWVDVKGAVNKPNIYCVKKDSMIEEIVIAAGGFHFNADLSSINRVSRISNESMIVIPFIKEFEAKKISINHASIDELITIPSIGESKAKAIIDYRNKNGRFMRLDDITKVSGIGNETYLKIKDYISL